MKTNSLLPLVHSRHAATGCGRLLKILLVRIALASCALEPSSRAATSVVAWGASVPPALRASGSPVSLGYKHGLPLRADGTVLAWGDNTNGETTVPSGLGGVMSISASGRHNLALKSDGTVVAWGTNHHGLSNIPAGLSDVVAVSAGYRHNVVLKADGTVVAWGDNFANKTRVPEGLSGVVAISASYEHTLALKADGTVVAWGQNAYGEVTVPAGLQRVVAVTGGHQRSLALNADGTVVKWGFGAETFEHGVAAMSDVASIAAGNRFALALRDDGSLIGWGGNNDAGQVSELDPVRGVTAMATGYAHSLVLKADGTVGAFGYNGEGRCNVPAGLANVRAVAAGGFHSVALRKDGTVVAWGDNELGQTSVPEGLDDVVAVAAGGLHTLALRADRTVAAWGEDGSGQASVPAGLSNVVQVAAGSYHSLALKLDGTVVAWGENNNQQATVPAGLANVVAIAAGGFYSLALKSDGTVVAWGYSDAGQQLPRLGLRNVVAIAAGADGAGYALRMDIPARLAPTVEIQPRDRVALHGRSATFTTWGRSMFSSATYRWQRSIDGGVTWEDLFNDAGFSGSNSPTLTVNRATVSMNGHLFRVVIRNAAGVETVSGAAALVVMGSARLLNLSTRGVCLTGADVLIPGFVVSGTENMRLLIRAVGPKLADFGVNSVLANPTVMLKRFVGNTFVDYASNDDWGTNGNAINIVTAAASVGAFPLNAGSADAALLLDVPPGAYTVVASGSTSSPKGGVVQPTGVALVEIYDVDPNGGGSRMSNISTRGFIGTGSDIMIPGYVISNEGPRTLLVRAVGPALGGLGVSGALADPRFTIYRRESNGGETAVASNDDWGLDPGAAHTAAVAVQVGAFPMDADSKDAALVVTLQPGVYTVQASGVGGLTGTALVEVYEVEAP